MTDQTIFANARLILEDEVITGSLVTENGQITQINTGASVPAGAIDLGGDFLAPGLVELHTDNLERHMSPRPKVDWPHRAAIAAHDRELAGSGITTVFDALRVGSIVSEYKGRYSKYARALATEILDMRAAGNLRISHHIHLRAEVCSETLQEELDEFTPEDRIGLVSMMDHTPGQRQFVDVQKFKDYICGKLGLSDAEFGTYADFLCDLQTKLGPKHEQATADAAQRLGATLASHDDTTAEQVGQSLAYGVKLAEFPTTLEAANACHDAGILTIMGAPNVIRGGSHSGNVAAIELAKHDRLDVLSSDYVPSGLLSAAVQLGAVWDDLPRAMALVGKTPASSVGLDDRGVLRIGTRADLIRFSMFEDTPILEETWSEGRRVF